ncbi:MAG TPA: DUF4126 domain-containing protein [Candidatus Saccharimonadales bacterium]|nr:DUF4126 domain-containing protein [Candidatus Saccharimonadales bacterium]
MNPLDAIALALGAGFSSGLNIYATVATLGFLERYGVIHLPASLHPISHPVVLGIAIALYLVEFFADKIPYFDTVWDGVHTFIRPPAAAFLAYAAIGSVPTEWRWGAALLAGGVALTSHGTKASARAAVNASPEPFSNWFLSLGEDLLAVWLTWMANAHPRITVIVVVCLIVLSVYILYYLFRFARAACRRLFT